MKKFYYFLVFSIACLSLPAQNQEMAEAEFKAEKPVTPKSFQKLLDSSSYYYNKGNYKRSFELNITLLKQALAQENPYLIHQGYRNLGYDYLVMEDTVMAQESFEKSSRYAEFSENEFAKAITYMDLANIYAYTADNYVTAFEYHRLSIKLFEKLQDSTYLARAHFNTILTSMEAGDYNKAYLHIIKARRLAKYDDEDAYTLALDNLLGEYHYEKGNYEMANQYLEKVIEDSKKFDSDIELENAWLYYSESLFKQGRTDEAYEARLKYEDYEDKARQSIMSAKNNALSAEFQVDEYRRDVLAAELENKLQTEIVKNKNRLNIILIIVAAVFLIMFFALFFAYRNRKTLVQELKLKNKHYLEAKENSEKLAKAKSKFFSTVSHELRTPLYGVIGLSTILLEDKTLKKHEKDLKSLKFSADYLLALINDVLQINKIDSNSIEDEKVTFNLNELIKKIVASFEYMRIQNNNKIHIHISESVPALMEGNSVRLSQILMNLISNACKFTENGDIYIIAETTQQTETTSAISFHVRDTGTGIPLEKQESIFDEFSQLENDNYKYHGTGLGLPIVKKLLHLSNSDLTVKSALGKGSLFSFTLNFKTVSKEIKLEAPPLLDDRIVRDKRILIVEDNRINQTVTKKILEKHGAKSTIAENGNEAIKLVKNENYDLILMDINMPVKNGIDATREIRQFDIFTPIVALTAVEIEEMKFSIYECGMNDIIVKPYDITKFIQTIIKNIALKDQEKFTPTHSKAN
ncbi:response regulator [Constantimarinum furrinae]|uniref:histidine kinase n=1 Tax=Constantimarinum furrinae TaxID=2562285 RepID=A0A7G8PSK4_9FLAO|nr:response regulator [Constantimarinum furrinae]QNJ97320.1 Histidine kinase [Constantimarinum furrinae]